MYIILECYIHMEKMAKLYCIAFMKKRARKLLAMRNMHQLQWKENGKWRFDYECKTNEIK